MVKKEGWNFIALRKLSGREFVSIVYHGAAGGDVILVPNWIFRVPNKHLRVWIARRFYGKG